MTAGKSIIIGLSVLFVGLVIISDSSAQDSLLISYQGRLTDDSGNPINGTPSITFTIYDESGVSMWTESHPSVHVNEGLFNVVLGSQTALPYSVFTGDSRLLGITVGVETELSPRTLLTSSPGAAVSRRVIGDIETAPGILEIHPPDPCVPPDPCQPAIEMVAESDTRVLRLHPPDPCVPPEPCTPALELIADAEINSFKIHPPEPCSPDPCDPAVTISATSAGNSIILKKPPPDDNKPAFEVNSDKLSEKISMLLGVPPDDSKPAFEVVSDGLSETVSMFLGVPPDDGKPAFEVVSDGLSETVSMFLGVPPDDNKPGVTINSTAGSASLMVKGGDLIGDLPLVTVVADAQGARIGIGTASPGEPLEIVSGGQVIASVSSSGVWTGDGSGLTDIDAALLEGIPGDEYVTLSDLTQQVLGYDPSDPYPGPTFWQSASDVVPLTVRSNTVDQVANLQEWKNNSGQVLASVSPAGTVEAEGFKMASDASDGYVLTSDADGNGTWQAPGSAACCQTRVGNGHGTGVIVVTFSPVFPVGVTPQVFATAVLTAASSGMEKGACPYAEVSGISNTGFTVTLKEEVGGSNMSTASADIHYMAIGSSD
jgi:hypothetical protein